MRSLYEVECEVQEFIEEHLTDDGVSLWVALVDSARRYGGGGCDGFLMAGVEQFTEGLLARMGMDQLREIWPETENGVLLSAQGLDDPERFEMIHDIGIDVHQHIVERVCREAKHGPKRRKT